MGENLNNDCHRDGTQHVRTEVAYLITNMKKSAKSKEHGAEGTDLKALSSKVLNAEEYICGISIVDLIEALSS